MKARIFRILGVIGFIIAMGSLSACFEGPEYPSYAYGRSAYAYPEYYPRYYPEYVPAPRYYAYNPRPVAAKPHPYWQYRQRWEREEHEEHSRHEHHDHDRF